MPNVCLGEHVSKCGSSYTRRNRKARFLSDSGLNNGWRTHTSHRNVPCVQFDDINDSTGRCAKSIKGQRKKMSYE